MEGLMRGQMAFQFVHKYSGHVLASMYLRMDMRMREYAVHADYAHIRKYLEADLIHIILI